MDLRHRATSLGSNISVLWIPSHVGITGNESADHYAKNARLNGTDRLSVYSTGCLLTKIARLCKSLVQLEWDLLEEPNKLWNVKKTFFCGFSTSSHDRRKAVVINRLMLGHCRFSHQFLLKGQPPPLCDKCSNPLTVKHILKECSQLINLREACNLSSDMSVIFSTSEQPKLFDFLERSGYISKI